MKTGNLATITLLALCQATAVLAQRIEKAPQTGLDPAWNWALTSSSARNDSGGFWV